MDDIKSNNNNASKVDIGDLINNINAIYKKMQSQLNTTTEEEDTNHLNKMKDAMHQILDELGKNKDEFKLDNVINLFDTYVESFKRILYSEITVYIYALNEEETLPIFMSNVDSVVEHYTSMDKEIGKTATKVFIKIWDHVNLANNQINKLKMNDDDFRDRVSPVMEKIDKTTTSLEDTKKDMYAQLISIVSIFVAISFVMFGGMTLLNNVFDYSGMSSIPLLEMMCGGSLIGIVMILVMYAFVILVMSISNFIEKKEIDDKNYPFKGLIKSVCIILLVLAFICGGTCIFMNNTNKLDMDCKIITENSETQTVLMECPKQTEKENIIESNTESNITTSE